MYVAEHFSLPGDQVRQLLAQVGAADLVTVHEGGPVATYLPFVFDPDAGEHGSLLTHVARNNSQAREATIGEALVIAHGADHYISPEWVPSQAESGTVVPTWNYLTVHAYGPLVVHDDPAWTRDVVSRTTSLHEQDYAVDRLSDDFVARMLRAIVGIEVRLTRIEAKAKMSQNKSPADVLGIVNALRAEAADEAAVQTAAWMERHSLPAAQRRAALLEGLATGPGGRRSGEDAGGG